MKFLDKLTSHKTQKNTALIYSREKTSVAVRLEHVSKIPTSSFSLVNSSLF